jgi:hypothetical protein
MDIMPNRLALSLPLSGMLIDQALPATATLIRPLRVIAQSTVRLPRTSR